MSNIPFFQHKPPCMFKKDMVGGEQRKDQEERGEQGVQDGFRDPLDLHLVTGPFLPLPLLAYPLFLFRLDRIRFWVLLELSGGEVECSEGSRLHWAFTSTA